MSSTHSTIPAAAIHRDTTAPSSSARSGHRSRARARRATATGRLGRGELLLLVLLGCALVACVFVSRYPDSTPERTTTVHVGTGDTLWRIAQAHPVVGLSTAQTADLIAELNDLGGSTLAAGTVIRVPDVARDDLASR